MFEQETLLERALRLAATDPVFIPEFYGTLLDSEVFVIGCTELGPQDELVEAYIKAGSHLHIQPAELEDGSTVIPFFSSLPALQRYIEEEGNYLRLPARGLFETTLGEDLFLNPASEFGKTFTAFEIDDLLRHGLPRRGRREVVEEETSVLIGQPSDYPHDITDKLSRFFASEPRVKAAYLAMMQIPDKEKKPTLCVGIACDPAHFDDISPAAGIVVSHLLGENRQLNFCRVDPETPGAPSDYMLNETEPFYRAMPQRPQPRKQDAPADRPAFGKRTSPSVH